MKNKKVFRKNLKGFSLVELMVVLSITAILMSWAIPSYRSFSIRQSISQQSNGLVTELTLARSQALNLSRNVVVQSKNGLDWTGGFWVYVDVDNNQSKEDLGDILVRDVDPVSNGVEIESDLSFISFNTVGFSSSGSVDINVSHPESLKKVIVSVFASGSISSRSIEI